MKRTESQRDQDPQDRSDKLTRTNVAPDQGLIMALRGQTDWHKLPQAVQDHIITSADLASILALEQAAPLVFAVNPYAWRALFAQHFSEVYHFFDQDLPPFLSRGNLAQHVLQRKFNERGGIFVDPASGKHDYYVVESWLWRQWFLYWVHQWQLFIGSIKEGGSPAVRALRDRFQNFTIFNRSLVLYNLPEMRRVMRDHGFAPPGQPVIVDFAAATPIETDRRNSFWEEFSMYLLVPQGRGAPWALWEAAHARAWNILLAIGYVSPQSTEGPEHTSVWLTRMHDAFAQAQLDVLSMNPRDPEKFLINLEAR